MLKDLNKKFFELRKVLLQLGISSNNIGFNYIIQAVNIIQKQRIHTAMSTIYSELANSNNTTTYAAERAIRYAITKSYKKNKILQQIYNNKPDNASFLYDLAFNLDIFISVTKKGKLVC